jgi:hypothetical protein
MNDQDVETPSRRGLWPKLLDDHLHIGIKVLAWDIPLEDGGYGIIKDRHLDLGK